MRIDCARRYRLVFYTPYRFEKMIARNHLSGISKEKKCQVKLPVRQVYHLIVQLNVFGAEVKNIGRHV